MARIAEGTVKLTEEDLWHRYRHPASIDALIPLMCVLEALRDEDEELADRDARARLFSMRIEKELKSRSGFADVELFYVFEADLHTIDGRFYRERWNTYHREDTDFARKTFVDNLMVPLDKLVALSAGGLPLPSSLKGRYNALKQVEEAKTTVGPAGAAPAHGKAELAVGALQIITEDEAVEIFKALDLNQTHLIEGRQQKLTTHNAATYLLEHGCKLAINKAAKAFSSAKGGQLGRSQDVMTKNDVS